MRFVVALHLLLFSFPALAGITGPARFAGGYAITGLTNHG